MRSTLLAYGVAKPSMLEALATDAGLLNDRFSAVALAHSKLWPGQIPEWLRISWGELRHALVDADENWGVWTNWYEQRLGGQATSQEIEIARVTIDNAIGGQEPRAVNAHIRELIEEREIFQDALSGEPENLPDAHEIPDQRSAASQFALDAEGRLDLLPDAPLADDLQREMYLEVRHKAPSSQVLAITSLQICQLPLIASAKPYRSTSRLFRSIAFGRGGTRCAGTLRRTN
jgi:hypothetical protein